MNQDNVISLTGQVENAASHSDAFHVLIELTLGQDCEFLARWLLMVVEAADCWSDLRCDDMFSEVFPQLERFPHPRLETAALAIISGLRFDHGREWEVGSGRVLAADFSFCEARGYQIELEIFQRLGLFQRSGEAYRLHRPEGILSESVQLAVLKAATDQRNGVPSKMLYMPKASAEAKAVRCAVASR